ncbi:hypothetical protein D9619_003299 [Psilocybe cf. subviscida]|uniref:Endonuclease/exonuclease/phosphatase domain-containing protein n=1 Tax=Psilocybe cf. subviscida TaxID=2480587 RepID=A0A8H5EUF1_9AGAR|nr:hypothetical protein D9619_003299 [Psilocybe cf. subviscida]
MSHQPPNSNTMPPKAQGAAPDPPGSRAATSSNIPRPGTAGPAPATSSPDPSGATSAREYYSAPTPGVPLRIRSATASRVASCASSPIRTATTTQESSPAPGSPDSEEEAEDEPITPTPAYLVLTFSADAAESDFSAITAALSSAHTWLVSNSKYDDTAHNNRLFTQRLYNLVDAAISARFGGIPTWDNKTLQHAFEGLFSPPTIPTSTQDLAPTSSAPPLPPPAASTLQDVNTVMGPITGQGQGVNRPPPKHATKPAPASKPIAARYKKPPPHPTIAKPPRRSYTAAARNNVPAPLPRAAAPAPVATPAARKRGKKVTPAYTRICANHLDPKPWVGLPASTSYLQIMGAPDFNDGTGTVRMQLSDFETMLLAAPFRELVQLSGPPRIIRDSRPTWGRLEYFRTTEPPWRLIGSALSAVNVEGEEVVGAPNQPSWIAMVRPPDPDTHPRLMAYVSTRLSPWRPSMRHDITDHRDVLVLLLFAEGHTFNFMNVYSDKEFTAIRLLAARTDTLPQFHYMGGDFNCHSSTWDPVPRPANVAASHWLLEAAATIGLELGTVSDTGPTHIPRDASKRPSVIDLVFLPVTLSASVPTERVTQNMLDSDHIPLLTHVPVSPAVRTALRRCLPSDPEKVQAFLDNLVAKLRLIVPDDVAETPDDVEAAASALASAFSEAWLAHSRDSNVTRHSNPWWTQACAIALQQHRAKRDPADWAHLRRTVKEAKRVFFNAQIAEIAVKSKRPWDLMNWVQQRKLPPCEAIQYQGQPCHEMSALWDALHGTYNVASGRTCDMTCADRLPSRCKSSTTHYRHAQTDLHQDWTT